MVDRKLTGAHYGLRDWAMQRATAVLMLIYTVALIVFLLAQISFIALFLHAWVGIRDLWMDYIKPFGLRLFLQVATIVWLAGCMVYSVKVIWG